MGALISNHPRVNFARLIRKIQPTASELKKARSYSISCRKRINKSFDLKKYKGIGSHSRNVAIRHYSDLDFLVLLSRNEAKWAGKIINSNTLLSKISQDLNDRYINTNIRKDGQAIVVKFGGGQNSMDIVPALFKGFQDRWPVYWIADGSGDWLETSPEGHNLYLKKANVKSGGKLCKTAQIIRYWKYCRSNSIPISSFYIDLMLANSEICIGVKSYTEIIYNFFNLMKEHNSRGIRDPMGIAGVIKAANTTAQLNTINSIIDYSYSHSKIALFLENVKDYKGANEQWDIVFNHDFI